MKEQFCTYEICERLHDLGFDEEVIATYTLDNKELSIFAFAVPNKGIFEEGFKRGWCIKAPLWQQAIDWLRVKHNIHVEVYRTQGLIDEGRTFGVQANDWKEQDKGDKSGWVQEYVVELINLYYDTYEEARENGINEVLNILIENNV